MTAKVVMNRLESDPFMVNISVEQGCVLAPVIFNLFLPARCYASAGNSYRNVSVCLSVRLSVRLSRAGIVSKRRKLAA